MSSLSMPPSTDSSDNDWASWARVVITTLDRYGEQIEHIFDVLEHNKTELKNDIEILRERSRKDMDTARAEFLAAVLQQGKGFTDSLSKQGSEWVDQLTRQKELCSERYNKHNVSLAELAKEVQIKAGIWGAIAGVIPVLITLFLMFLKSKGDL